MKKTILLSLAVLVITSFCFHSNAQTTVTSTEGYSVSLNVFPVAIVPATNGNCDWGYNYQVKMHYNISITGANAPASLYTLQGTVGCGSTTSFFDLPNSSGSGNQNSSSAWSPTSDCNSANVTTKNCNTVRVQIHGPGINDQIVTMSASNIALPIRLVNFSTIPQEGKVKIAWATASEENNEYFTVERSSDGANWSELKKIKGAVNSNRLLSYETYDASPLSGTSFYRIKQTDFDGKSSYSNTQSIKYASASKSISLYPIPNTGNTVTIAGLSSFNNYDFTLLNTDGTIVFKTQLTKGSVDLPQIKGGVYIVRITDKTSGKSESFPYAKI